MHPSYRHWPSRSLLFSFLTAVVGQVNVVLSIIVFGRFGPNVAAVGRASILNFSLFHSFWSFRTHYRIATVGWDISHLFFSSRIFFFFHRFNIFSLCTYVLSWYSIRRATNFWYVRMYQLGSRTITNFMHYKCTCLERFYPLQTRVRTLFFIIHLLKLCTATHFHCSWSYTHYF